MRIAWPGFVTPSRHGTGHTHYVGFSSWPNYYLSFRFRFVVARGNASCHLMRPGQMNQDYVRPKKSVHSLHHACRPEEPPLTVQQQEGGSQSTR